VAAAACLFLEGRSALLDWIDEAVESHQSLVSGDELSGQLVVAEG
jgi:hypothetical protein